MAVLDVLRGLFGGARKPTQADALEAIRKQYPIYAGVADDVLAKAAAAKLPGQFGYLKDYNPKAEVPPEAVPAELRDDSFYKANPVLGTKDALDVVERFKKANPKFKNIEAKKIAAALERKFPENPRVRGLYGRLVGTTEGVPAVPVGPEPNTLGDRREVAAGVRMGGDDRGLPKLAPAQDLYRSGLKSFLMGDEDAALKAWGDASKIDPGLLEARRGVERIMLKRQPPPAPKPEAVAVYKTGLESFLAGRPDEAKVAWGRAVELDPNMLEAKRGLERLGLAEKAAAGGAVEPLPNGWPQPALPVDDGVGPAQAAFTALSVGADRFNAALARTPNLIYNVAALPVNLALKAAGMPEIKDPQIFEGAAKWWDEKADEADLARKYWKGENALSLAKKKDPKELSKYLAYQVMANAPQQALFIASALAGAPVAGLAMMGTTSASSSLAEGREKGAGPAAATLNAAMNGVIEAGFENLGTLSIMQKWGKALARSMGEKAAKGVIADAVKTLFGSVGREGGTEALTSLGQDFAQVVTGVDKDAMKGSVARAFDAFAVGGLSGGAMTAPATIASAVDQAARARADKDVAGAPAPAGTAPAPEAAPAPSTISASSRFADLFPVPTVEEFFRETPEEVEARRKAELEIFKKPEPTAVEDPGEVSTERAEDFGPVVVPPEVVLAHAKGKHKAALEAWEGKVTPLEVFIRANGGLRIDGTERGEFLDVPVRLRGRRPKAGEPDVRKLPSDMEQMAKEQGIIPAETNIYRELDSIKKRGERPSLSEFIEEARAEMDHEYAVYGPPVERTAEAEVEPAPFERGPGYTANEQRETYSSESPIFYSQLQKTIDEKVPNSAPVDQVRNILKGGAVKQEEIEWSGIEDFLTGKVKVSKAELLDFLRGNEVKVQEVVKGEAFPGWSEKDVRDHYRDMFGEPASPQRSLESIKKAIAENEEGEPTKFASYQLPGGENYREILLTLPSEKPAATAALEDFIQRMQNKYAAGGQWRQKISSAEEAEAQRLQDAERSALQGGKDFRSSHFDEPNILAHVRLNDRTTADGKKMLFLEEVQSDWHQKGREVGYKSKNDVRPAAADEIDLKFIKSVVPEGHDPDNYPGYWESFDRRTGEMIVRHPGSYTKEQALKEALQYSFYASQEAGSKRVPNAPFKKTWHELALKRMLRYAVDNGYDAIGWTTGAQQAERYDLSKQVHTLAYKLDSTGSYWIEAKEKPDSQFRLLARVTKDNLAATVGKDLAGKIIGGEGKQEGDYKQFSGIDLKVGGEGMKGFYDQMIPSFLNKYTKRWGGRVGQSNIGVIEDVRHEYIGPEYTVDQLKSGLVKMNKSRNWSDKKSPFTGDEVQYHIGNVSNTQSVASVIKGMEEGLSFRQSASQRGNPNAAELFGGRLDRVEERGSRPAHSLEITPSMRESVKQGQSLFERQPGLFGGAEPIVVKKLKPGDPGQMTLFGQKAQPKFEVPDSAFKLEEVRPSEQAQQLSMTEEGGHQVDMVIPRALRESVVIKDLAEQGFLPVHKMRVEGPADTAAIFHFLKNQTVESFYILAKDADGKILGAELVSLGIIDQTLVNPRDSLKGAMLLGAKKLSLVHNHPSGNPTPSKEDLAITRVLARAAESVGMAVDHHVVINDTKYGVIEMDQDGAPRARIETRRGDPPAAGERTRLVKPMRTSASDEAAITTPEGAVAFAKGVQGGQGGVMLIAMDTRNQPTGAWYLGDDYPPLKDLTRDVGRIAMRNNAAGVIFSSARMPQRAYMEAVSKEMQSVWSVNVLDFVAPRGKSGVGGFESARQSGVMGEGKTPYGQFEQPYSPQKLHSKPPAPPAEEAPEGQAELAFDVTEEDMKEAEEIFGKEMTEAEMFAIPAANRTRRPPQDVLDALLAPEERLNDLALGEAGKFSTLAPLRAVERMDGKRFGLMKERFLRPIQDADKAFQRELKEHREEIARVFDGMSLEERNLVFDLVENKEQSKIVQAMEEGAVFEGMDWKERKLVMDVLNGKVKRETVKPGTRAADALEFFAKEKGKFSRPGERVLNAVSFLRMAYDDLLDRINKARADIGKDPIRKRDNYITHYQEMSAINDILMMMGHNMTEVPASMLTISAMTKPNSPYFKFAKRRLGEKTSRDARQAFSIYIEPALRAIHFSRAIKNGRDILEYKVTIPSDYEGGKTDSLSLFGIRYPNAYKYFTEYLNRLSGKRDSTDRDHPGAAAVAGLATRLFGPGSIGGNIGTILVQPSSLRNTVTETGLFAVRGHMEIMTPDGMRFYRKNSRVGLGRAYEPSAKNERLMGSRALARAHDLTAEVLAIPVGAVDHLMVGGAFLAGYHKGKALGLSEEDAIRYADDVAERTQASANIVDRPPVNASKIRVALFQFQTFVYNEYSQFKNDVFRRMIEGDKRNKQGYAEEGLGAVREGKDAGYRRFAWLVLATIVLGRVIEGLGLPNPYDDDEATTPLFSNKWTDPVWQHIINSIPGVSSVRFGGSPLVKGVLAGMAYLSGDEAAKARAKSRLKNIGVRVIPGGGQISKTLSAVPILGKVPDLADRARALIYGKWILNKKTAAYRKLRKQTLKGLAAVRAGELDINKLGAEEKADLRRRIGKVRGIERQRRSLARIDKAGGRGPRVDAFRKKLQGEMEAAE